ncbi:MAG: hypothetical protein EOM05_11405 [Clostridia bacterium]|nr:hypothetical protein [Clostridia bacterium]
MGVAYKVNSNKCKAKGGVCATFSKKLGKGDSCMVAFYNGSGVVEKNLCGGNAYTVCCTGILDALKADDLKVSNGIVQDSECVALQGVCQKRTETCKNGTYYSGYCPSSGSDVRCCVQTLVVVQDTACTEAGGKCQKTSVSCGGTFLTGYCPSSGSDVKCCVPKAKSSSTITQDSKCENAGGVCKNVSEGCSGGTFLTGYCPSSGSSVKCCVRNSGR